jgi:hypothetical protein
MERKPPRRIVKVTDGNGVTMCNHMAAVRWAQAAGSYHLRLSTYI